MNTRKFRKSILLTFLDQKPLATTMEWPLQLRYRPQTPEDRDISSAITKRATSRCVQRHGSCDLYRRLGANKEQRLWLDFCQNRVVQLLSMTATSRNAKARYIQGFACFMKRFQQSSGKSTHEQNAPMFPVRTSQRRDTDQHPDSTKGALV